MTSSASKVLNTMKFAAVVGLILIMTLLYFQSNHHIETAKLPLKPLPISQMKVIEPGVPLTDWPFLKPYISQIRPYVDGKTVLYINFWAHWCGPCLTEIPKLQELFVEVRKKNVMFLMINLDKDEKNRDLARQFLDKNNIDIPNIFAALDKDSPKQLPSHMLVTPQAQIVSYTFGNIESQMKKFKEWLRLLSLPEEKDLQKESD